MRYNKHLLVFAIAVNFAFVAQAKWTKTYTLTLKPVLTGEGEGNKVPAAIQLKALYD